MEEEWRDVCGFEGKYQVSNLGNVKSLNYNRTGKEKILRPRENRWGYLLVCLSKEGECKWYKVHRLVLSTFSPCENMESLLVNHKDENKLNNRLENLEWCTYSYNNTYNGRHKRIGEKEAIPIVQLDPHTNKVVNVWGSSMAAERECGYSTSGINQCCKGKRNTHKDYKWQYLHYYISQIDLRIKKVILFGKEYVF